jgi:outer membrane protein OmpA-like peptidoglycan-associated protein
MTGSGVLAGGWPDTAAAQVLFQDNQNVSPGLSQGFADSDNDQLLGPFGLKPPAAPEADRAPTVPLPPAPAPSDEKQKADAQKSGSRKAEQRRTSPPAARSGDPVELYLSALAELNFGRLLQAEQLLKKVIALNPESDIAELSRRRLEDLVRNREKGNPNPSNPVAESTPGALPPDAAVTPPVSGVRKGENAPPVRSGRDLALEQAFRNEVGDRVFFGPGSAELGARAKAAIASQARWLLNRPEVDARVEGHADEPGSAAQNMELSRVRATAVRERLIAEGLDADRVQVRAFGRERRIAECDGPECRAQNSRVVTVVYASGRLDHRKSGALSSGVSSALPRVTRDASVEPDRDRLRVPR